MHWKRNRRWAGFTLVELLVVIAIIGILAAALLPAVNIAIYQAKKNAVSVEIKQLEMALLEYRTDKGDLPPDFSHPGIVQQHLLKSYPRLNSASPDETKAIADAIRDLDQAEALVFWLSGVYDDPRRPFTGGGPFWGDNNPRQVYTGGASLKKYFDFKEEQLVDRDNDGYPEYMSPSSEGAPYVYFESRTYGLLRNRYTPPTSGGLNIKGIAQPYFHDPPQTAATQAQPQAVFANPDTFQIICAFTDGDYGNADDRTATTPGSRPRLFPSASNYTRGDLDNLTNFSDGKTLEDSRPDD